MMFRKSLVLSFAASVLAIGAGAAGAESAPSMSFKPLQAFRLDVGAKRALGYYLENKGNCDLTVLLADISYPDDGILPSASRFGVKVAAGTSAKIDTVDGQTVSFACAARAERMTVSVVQRLAFSPAGVR